MPVLCFRSNILLSQQHQQAFLAEAVKLVAAVIGRKACQVMASYLHCEMLLGDSPLPAVYAELQSITLLTEIQCRTISTGFLDVFNRYTNLDPSRIYLYFPVVNPDTAWKFAGGYAVCPGSILTGEEVEADG